MNKVKTTKINGGADYALVPDRLKAFREANPRASVKSEPKTEGDSIIFTTTIIKDKADPSSAEANGHSYGKLGQVKAFEKLETVSIGRALSKLGYLNNGEIASTEEMEEFEAFQTENYAKQIEEAKDTKELMQIFKSMSQPHQTEFTPLLSKKKKELAGGTADGTVA